MGRAEYSILVEPLLGTTKDLSHLALTDVSASAGSFPLLFEHFDDLYRFAPGSQLRVVGDLELPKWRGLHYTLIMDMLTFQLSLLRIQGVYSASI